MKQTSALLAGLCLVALAQPAAAQGSWPERPVHLLVGFPAGSQPDIVARLIAQKLTETEGKPVVVENITGSAGNIAADRVAKAAPDGYTIGLLSQTHMVVNPALYKLPFDPVKDFAPISRVTMSANMLVVNNAVPAKTVTELVNLARLQPGGLTFASSGNGTGSHMAAELFMASTATILRHVPYKGVVAAIPDLVAGRVTMMFSPIPVVLPLVREGRLRALAITSLQRSPAVPELPTVAESGYPGFAATNWYGLVAPAGTPQAIVRRLHLDTLKALQLPDVRAGLERLGIEVTGDSPEEFAAAIRAEMPIWAKVIKDAGIKPDH
jgi:tripartite-type tricarboxylate transporter receptor subunit TctC